MSGSYKLGEVSELLSSQKKKKRKLDALFSSDSPYRCQVKESTQNLTQQRKQEVCQETSGRECDGGNLKKNKKTTVKKDKIKKELKKDNERDEKGRERGKNGQSEGFCPPPGVIHESLVKGAKEKKTRVEEREESLAVSKGSTKKKKRKRNEEDEDEDPVTPRKRIKVDNKRDPNIDAKTIFVGNLPVDYDTKAVRKLFKKYGKIQSVRLRSATPAKISLPKKVAVIKKDYHPDRTSINAYVVFAEEEEANKALKRNGKVVDGHHIVADLVTKGREFDHKKSVFVGNLPFGIEDDELWDCFDEIGNIKSVRVIRDRKTGIGKGFGYVHFKDVTSVDLALKLNGKTLKNRSIRVTRAQTESQLQKDVLYSSDQKSKKKKKFSKPSNAVGGSFQGQKALTDEQLQKVRKRQKMARSGVRGKGKKANVLNALLRLKKKQGTGVVDSTSATSPKIGKKKSAGKINKKNVLGKKKKGLMGGKKTRDSLGKGKKRKTKGAKPS